MTDKQNNTQNDPASQNTDAPTPKKTDIQRPDLWQFPMDYPLKVIGNEGEHENFVNEVKLILGSLFPEFDLASIQVKPSKTGRYYALSAKLHLTSAEQVNALYAALDKAKTIRMVL